MSAEEWDRLKDRYVKAAKRVDDLRALESRGEAGEREAAKNALREHRISALEAAIALLFETVASMQESMEEDAKGSAPDPVKPPPRPYRGRVF